jgi:hypothetical protein
VAICWYSCAAQSRPTCRNAYYPETFIQSIRGLWLEARAVDTTVLITLTGPLPPQGSVVWRVDLCGSAAGTRWLVGVKPECILQAEQGGVDLACDPRPYPSMQGVAHLLTISVGVVDGGVQVTCVPVGQGRTGSGR